MDKNVLKFKELCRSIKELGITSFSINYSGYNGSVNESEYHHHNDPKIKDLMHQMDDYMWEIISNLPIDGFWNNEGGKGVFVVDCVRETWHINHQDNYYDSENK